MLNRDHLRQILNIIFAITQILAGGLHEFTGLGQSIPSQSKQFETPVIPSSYAFSIWGLIFLTCIIYSVYQALPRNRENELLRNIGFLTAGAFFFNTLWQLVAQLVTFSWPTVLIIACVLGCSVLALFKMTDYKDEFNWKQKIALYVPISSLAGWVSAATFANISSVLKQLNIDFELTQNNLAIIILSMAAALAFFVTIKSKGNLIYALSVSWALFAVFIANLWREPNPQIAWVTLLLILPVIGASFIYKKEA